MGAGQHTDFAGDLPDLIEGATIGATTILQHLVAEDLLFQVTENLAGFGRFGFIGEERNCLRLRLVDTAVAFEF